MVGNKRKYPKWGDFIKKRRIEKFRSAREFCAQNDVGISYPQYSRYEAGEQLPNLEQALKLFRLLDVAVLEGLLEWSRAQVADDGAYAEISDFLDQVRSGSEDFSEEAAKNLLQERADSGEPLTRRSASDFYKEASISLDDVIVLNRSHLKLLKSDPLYRDLFTYIYAYAPDWIPVEELAAGFPYPVEKVSAFLEKLADLGVILFRDGQARSSKKNCYFPDDEDFFELRNLNITHNVSQIIEKVTHDDLREGRAYRSLVTRELSPRQVQAVISGIDELIAQVVGLSGRSQGGGIHSLCIALGERFKRTRVAARPGLKTGSPSPQERSGRGVAGDPEMG